MIEKVKDVDDLEEISHDKYDEESEIVEDDHISPDPSSEKKQPPPLASKMATAFNPQTQPQMLSGFATKQPDPKKPQEIDYTEELESLDEEEVHSTDEKKKKSEDLEFLAKERSPPPQVSRPSAPTHERGDGSDSEHPK